MEPARAALALADASASLTRSQGVIDALVALVGSCAQGLSVDAVGVLVEHRGALELVAASSHAATELEVHQLHADEGPCVDAHRSGEPVQASTSDELLSRWPAFGRTMTEAGFASVNAVPLAWHDRSFGAIGMFRRSATPFTDAEHTVARAFADIASALVLRIDDVQPDELARRLDEAFAGRIVVEQAKGVLADQRDLTMSDAYAALVHDAAEAGTSLTAWAARVVDDAASGHRG